MILNEVNNLDTEETNKSYNVDCTDISNVEELFFNAYSSIRVYVKVNGENRVIRIPRSDWIILKRVLSEKIEEYNGTINIEQDTQIFNAPVIRYTYKW